MRAVIYPDSDDTGTSGTPATLGDGTDSTYDRVEHKCNRQGEIKETKDQNETVHTFEFDKLGRSIHDRVITAGSDVDNAVLRISTTYEVRGMVEKITSYDNATAGTGNMVNEVLREYNDFGLLDREYQEHDGAKDANTPYVGYNYDQTASAGEFTKGLRPTSLLPRRPLGALYLRQFWQRRGQLEPAGRHQGRQQRFTGHNTGVLHLPGCVIGKTACDAVRKTESK